MAKLTAATCDTVKPDPKRDRLLGDGDGLFLRVRSHATKTWVIEYEFQGKRTKYTIGGYSRQSAPGGSISDWLKHGQQSLAQARSIAGCWQAAEAEAALPTVKDTIESFMTKIIDGKKSASAVRYRLDRLATIIGETCKT